MKPIKVLKVNELNDNSNKLLEMANIGFESTGIPHVVIWIEPKPPYHGHRVKVSNKSDSWSKDNFTITIPEFEIIGDINKNLITDDVFKKIIQFIEINKDSIFKLSNQEIDGAQLKQSLKSINSKIGDIEKLNEEFIFTNTVSEEEMQETNMTPFGILATGIPNVLIWLGQNPHYNKYRIKVSNIPNKWGSENCFTITIPDFIIHGNVNKELITDEVLNKIIKFIKLNIKAIIDYSDNNLLTDELIDLLKPVE